MVVDSTCGFCAQAFTYERVGRGRRRKYCSDACAAARDRKAENDRYRRLTAEEKLGRRVRNPNRRTLPCSECGALMFQCSRNLPEGLAVCQTCRSKWKASLRERVPCEDCGGPSGWYVTDRRRDTEKPVICNACRRVAAEKRRAAHAAEVLANRRDPKHRRHSAKAKTSDRGYGYTHQKRRRKLLAELTPGAVCPFCDKPMDAGQYLDLDHSEPDTRLLGLPGDRLAHASCNRKDGARRANAARTGTPKRDRNCVICGAPFPYRSDQRACGRACGRELRRRNQHPEGGHAA